MAARTRAAVYGAFSGRLYGSFSRGVGTIVVEDFRNWAGTAQVSFDVAHVAVLNLEDGSLALSLEDKAVDANGDMTISDAAISAGSTYMVVGWDADGTNSFRRAVTAT